MRLNAFDAQFANRLNCGTGWQGVNADGNQSGQCLYEADRRGLLIVTSWVDKERMDDMLWHAFDSCGGPVYFQGEVMQRRILFLLLLIFALPAYASRGITGGAGIFFVLASIPVAIVQYWPG